MYQILTSKLFIMPRKLGRILGINKLIRSLLEVGDYQERFDKSLINSVINNDILWDIGSNNGEIIKKAKNLFSDDIYIVAFEPHPILSANLKSLDFKNVKVINAALSDTVGEAEFIYGLDPEQTTGRIGVNNSINSDKSKVKVVDIQYALETLNLKNPHIIKIDVEGHEYEVLSSILLNIEKLINLRAIFVEIHMTIIDNRNLTIKMNKLIEKFKIEKNFKIVWIDVSHFKLER